MYACHFWRSECEANRFLLTRVEGQVEELEVFYLNPIRRGLHSHEYTNERCHLWQEFVSFLRTEGSFTDHGECGITPTASELGSSNFSSWFKALSILYTYG